MQTTPRFTINEADRSHIDFLCEFGRRAFIGSYRCTLPLNELEAYTEQAFGRQAIVDEINSPSTTYLVCEDENTGACGYAKLVDSEPPACIQSMACIELQRLYVDDHYQGRGIGGLLATRCESHARERKLDTLWLRVWDGNRSAIDIYRKWGFSVVGDAPYAVGAEQRTVLLMRKRLTRAC